jgi:glycosyltransferase involved in cell wall biosynthesis
MLAGLPVIVTPGGALPELVRDGETGVVADGFGAEDLAKAIRRMIESNKTVRMAESGQASIRKNFDIRTSSANTMKIYMEATK